MQLRLSKQEDRPFLVEMARLACTLEDRPLPPPDDPDVIALLPGPDAAVIATDNDGRPVGAAWWHVHEPPLLCDANGEALPELAMGVLEGERGRGIGAALLDALAAEASKHFSALTLNVHLRNPATHLYTRTGFRVTGAGRGWFGVAMRKPLGMPHEMQSPSDPHPHPHPHPDGA